MRCFGICVKTCYCDWRCILHIRVLGPFGIGLSHDTMAVLGICGHDVGNCFKRPCSVRAQIATCPALKEYGTTIWVNIQAPALATVNISGRPRRHAFFTKEL